MFTLRNSFHPGRDSRSLCPPPGQRREGMCPRTHGNICTGRPEPRGTATPEGVESRLQHTSARPAFPSDVSQLPKRTVPERDGARCRALAGRRTRRPPPRADFREPSRPRVGAGAGLQQAPGRGHLCSPLGSDPRPGGPLAPVERERPKQQKRPVGHVKHWAKRPSGERGHTRMVSRRQGADPGALALLSPRGDRRPSASCLPLPSCAL